MILVVGEALVDLVVDPDGTVRAALGGAPCNTAVAAARLGCPVAFAGAISTDRFGGLLLDRLTVDGVDVARAARVDAPTSLAMAEVDEAGVATYRFYFSGTSVPRLARLDTSGVDAIVTGGLALVLGPMATVVEDAVVQTPLPLVVDVNCRPAVIDDLVAYRSRVDRIVGAATIVKVSDDDLDVLRPGAEPVAAAHELTELGAGAVIVTRGAHPTTVVTASGEVEVPVPPLPAGAEVIDTIGAGDTFGAGLVTALHEHGCFGAEPADRGAAVAPDVLVEAVRLGHAAAAITVTRRGADPPRRDEIASPSP